MYPSDYIIKTKDKDQGLSYILMAIQYAVVYLGLIDRVIEIAWIVETGD